jgi:PAS domain S-box-containing protein
VDDLVRADTGDHPRPLAASLSPREKQLLLLAARGLTDQGIAHHLGISLATVGTYWGRVRIKFGPLSRTELVAVYLREEAGATIAELKESNSKLIRELEEHSKTATMLLTSLEMFRNLIETAPDAIVIVDESGVVKISNEQAEELFGYGHGEMVGLMVEDLVPDRYRVDHVENRRTYVDNPIKRKMGEHLALVAKKKDSTEFAMAAALSPTQTPDGLLITCIIRDLSDQLE